MVEFKFIDYGTDFGTRDMGQRLREKLLPLINGDEKVVLDSTWYPIPLPTSVSPNCFWRCLWLN